MGRSGTAPARDAARSPAIGSTRRGSGDGCLDPVRWRRPGRGTLLRLSAVAVLLATAAVTSWSPAAGCGPWPGAAGAGPPWSSADASRPSSTAGASPPSSTARASPPSSTAGASSTAPAGATVGSAAPRTDGAPAFPVTRPDDLAAGVDNDAHEGADARGSTETRGGAETSSGTEARGGAAGRAVPDGTVGVPVRLAEPAALAFVRPGDRVDLLRTGDAARRTAAVAKAALVLEVGAADDSGAGGLLLALNPADAERAATGSGDGFAVLVRPG